MTLNLQVWKLETKAAARVEAAEVAMAKGTRARLARTVLNRIVQV